MTNCRSCLVALAKEEDVVTLTPCGCCLCKDCMIQFLAHASTKECPLVMCSSCDRVVTSHQMVRMTATVGGGVEKVRVRHDYIKSAVDDSSVLAAAAAAQPPTPAPVDTVVSPSIPGFGSHVLVAASWEKKKKKKGSPKRKKASPKRRPRNETDGGDDDDHDCIAGDDLHDDDGVGETPTAHQQAPDTAKRRVDAFLEKSGIAASPAVARKGRTAPPPEIDPTTITKPAAKNTTQTTTAKRPCPEPETSASVELPRLDEEKDEASTPVDDSKEQPAKKKRKRPRSADFAHVGRPKSYNRRRTFDEHFEQLVMWKEQHGHCNVPYRDKNRRLAEWVKDIRRCHVNFDKTQRKRLNELGFNWETNRNKFQREWEQKLAKLVAYKEKYGDCRVSQSYEDKQLSEWVCTQRKEYKKGKLKPHRIKALDEIGFIWAPSTLPRKKPPSPRKRESDASEGEDAEALGFPLTYGIF